MRGGITVACVRTGNKYGMNYVTKLRNMVARHLTDYELVCLTDQPEQCSGVSFINISEIGLTGWWAKMLLFSTEWREQSRVIYLDLDIVVCGDLKPLTEVTAEFAILRSPVHEAGNLKYPCRYNSSVMVLREGMTDFIWRKFSRARDSLIADCGNYGDQLAIERLYPDAVLLHEVLPKGFITNYRNLTMIKPPSSIITFGGAHKPDNCDIPWVQKEWA